jgi:hypothetical protein
MSLVRLLAVLKSTAVSFFEAGKQANGFQLILNQPGSALLGPLLICVIAS